ncbi:MAG: hypothetical protein QM785_11115 [Pyrinomonadaceae bacterium]
MLHKINKNMVMLRSLFILVAFIISAGATIVRSQAPTSTPKADEETYNGYRVAGTAEFGWRWRSLDGNENKYRSDLNYKQGFRTFDSNLFMETDKGQGKWFDSLLVSNSGWGSDPSGYTRVNIERTGFYKFRSSVRKVSYFNNLSTFTAVADPNQHTQNTKNTISDFDLTVLPQNELIRINFGVSLGNYTGPGTWNMRWNSDEFKLDADTDQRTTDTRVGAEGKLAGFNWGITQGFRQYKDRSEFLSNSLNQGHNATNTTAVSSFSRRFPTDGHGYYTQANINRTFAKKLDFTGRALYSSTNSATDLIETVVGRDASNNFIDQDLYTAKSRSKRPQTRADLGLTYNATDSLRISNTFTLDQFTVNGGEAFTQDVISRTAAGVVRVVNPVRSWGYRVESYRRMTNTLEGDYQLNKYLTMHIGWRTTKRKVDSFGYDASLSATTGITTVTQVAPETAENTTNTLIGGMKIKPIKHWTIFWDVEKGSADNVFGRLENYDFTNFRVRSKYVVNKFSFDVALISKDNTNPQFAYPAGTTVIPSFGFAPVTDIKSRFYSANMSWDPVERLNISGGYTYRNQDTVTPVIFPYQTCTTVACTAGTSVWNTGSSEFYMRDHYGYIEVAAKPADRVSLFATYRLDKDTGQGDLVSPILANTFPPQATGVLVYKNIIGGYPMSFATPEFRVAFRLSRNVDWNVGYQYFKYDDVKTPSQNYKAHLPFTSLRIYFGGRAADR